MIKWLLWCDDAVVVMVLRSSGCDGVMIQLL